MIQLSFELHLFQCLTVVVVMVVMEVAVTVVIMVAMGGITEGEDTVGVAVRCMEVEVNINDH